MLYCVDMSMLGEVGDFEHNRWWHGCCLDKVSRRKGKGKGKEKDRRKKEGKEEK